MKDDKFMHIKDNKFIHINDNKLLHMNNNKFICFNVLWYISLRLFLILNYDLKKNINNKWISFLIIILT